MSSLPRRKIDPTWRSGRGASGVPTSSSVGGRVLPQDATRFAGRRRVRRNGAAGGDELLQIDRVDADSFAQLRQGAAPLGQPVRRSKGLRAKTKRSAHFGQSVEHIGIDHLEEEQRQEHAREIDAFGVAGDRPRDRRERRRRSANQLRLDLGGLAEVRTWVASERLGPHQVELGAPKDRSGQRQLPRDVVERQPTESPQFRRESVPYPGEDGCVGEPNALGRRGAPRRAQDHRGVVERGVDMVGKPESRPESARPTPSRDRRGRQRRSVDAPRSARIRRRRPANGSAGRTRRRRAPAPAPAAGQRPRPRATPRAPNSPTRDGSVPAPHRVARPDPTILQH